MKPIIDVVAGARPNLMKIAPVIAALAGKVSAEHVLVHSGQHYDSNMSNVFSCQLEIPDPATQGWGFRDASGEEAWL